MKRLGFSGEELKSIAGLSSVIGFRMLGLSMLIPVFSVYAIGLPEATPFLAGVAFGIYGLTQAFLQIPFGYMSDRLGRKPVVAVGLLIFGVGSILAAITDDIYILIIARFLQGAGAIASTCFAWIADLTHESRRNMAMAFMGIAVGGSVVAGMIAGPLIGGAMGVPFLFWLATAFSVVAIFITLLALKEPVQAGGEQEADFTLDPWKALSYVAKPDLIKLDIAGFMLNMTMIAVFFAIPIQLAEKFPMSELWKIYVPLSVFGAMAMMLSSHRADNRSPKNVISGAIGFIAISVGLLAFSTGFPMTLGGFSIFFAAFSVLEAVLPAAVSKLADPVHKGAIIGVYNFSQFMGTFLGGVLAGIFAGEDARILFAFLAVANIVTVIVVFSARGVQRA